LSEAIPEKPKGQPFIKNGKTLLSAVDPIRRAERAADAVEIGGKTLYFCPSPLYGYGLDRFLSRLEELNSDSAVLCIEADTELFALSLENLPSSITQNKRLRLTNICGNAELASLVREKWGSAAFRRIETLRLTGGYQLFPELYDSLIGTLQREIATDWSNALTLTKLGRLYIRNFFRNLSFLARETTLHKARGTTLQKPCCRSIADISFGEAPVLVLGAGPSLDDVLDVISDEQGAGGREQLTGKFSCSENRAFKIVCVDTCLRALKDRGIVPDIVVILESQHWNLRDFSGCKGWNVPAAVDLSALPASARVLDGNRYFFFTPWTPLRVFKRLKEAELLPAMIPPLGSVGLTAADISRRLTKGKIICAGLDFSFTQEKYHARGTPGHRSRLNTQTRFRGIGNTAAYGTGVFSVVSKSGVSVYSNPVMKNYRDLFEQEFGGDPRLFDIEGIGLSLGIKTLAMEEALEELGIKNRYELISRRRRGSEIEEEKNKENLNITLDISLKNEKKHLIELRDMLTGEIAADKQRLEFLIDDLDYLWAHFPDCTGGRRPDIEDITFLKRVRMEIEPMLRICPSNPC